MRVLFDQGTPAPLRTELHGHEVSTAHETGWSTLTNGNLLRAAAKEFDVLLTTDQSLPHQQNLEGIDLAVVILPTTNWTTIRQHAALVRDAIGSANAGQAVYVSFPD
jgi:hypothetical protein